MPPWTQFLVNFRIWRGKIYLQSKMRAYMHIAAWSSIQFGHREGISIECLCKWVQNNESYHAPIIESRPDFNFWLILESEEGNSSSWERQGHTWTAWCGPASSLATRRGFWSFFNAIESKNIKASAPHYWPLPWPQFLADFRIWRGEIYLQSKTRAYVNRAVWSGIQFGHREGISIECLRKWVQK